MRLWSERELTPGLCRCRYTVVEREGKLLACAMLRPLGQSDDGVGCAEIAAFCVHPAYRGSGRGDSLLDFLGVRVTRTGLHGQCLLAQPQAISDRMCSA